MNFATLSALELCTPEALRATYGWATRVDKCMAAPARHGTARLCGLPRAGVWRYDLPLCLNHLRPPRTPRWMFLELRRERIAGLAPWLRARASLAREVTRPVCPSCGCGAGKVCRILWDGGEGCCAPAGAVPGHKVCSGCVTRWFGGGPGEGVRVVAP